MIGHRLEDREISVVGVGEVAFEVREVFWNGVELSHCAEDHFGAIQEMAIGLGADWVEAVEKPQENDVFQRCVMKNPLQRSPDGRFMIREALPGWGLELDEAKLRTLAAEVVELEPVEQPLKMKP